MSAGQPRMYAELSGLWRFVSPPEDYGEEVATFVKRFRRHGVRDGGRVLHLGSGGGSIDRHLARTYEVRGVEASLAMLTYASRVNPEEFVGAMERAGFRATVEPWELTDWDPGEEVPLATAVLR